MSAAIAIGSATTAGAQDSPVKPSTAGKGVETARLNKEAASRANTTEEQISQATKLFQPIKALIRDLSPNPNFVAVEVRYNPLRVAVLMTASTKLKTRFDVPVVVQVVPRSKRDLDNKVSAAITGKVGFAARPDYVRGVVVVTTDNVKSKRLDGYEFELGNPPRPVASGGEQISNGATCTSAFRVNGNAILTAGHCRNESGTIYPWQGGTQAIGAAANQNCNNDVQVHSVSGASEPTAQGVPISGFNDPYVGVQFRKFGYATGNTSGTVVSTGVQWYLVGSSECASPDIILSGFQSNAPSFPGDSGGPTIVCQNESCSGAAGVGITSAEFTAGTYSTLLSSALVASGSWLG